MREFFGRFFGGAEKKPVKQETKPVPRQEESVPDYIADATLVMGDDGIEDNEVNRAREMGEFNQSINRPRGELDRSGLVDDGGKILPKNPEHAEGRARTLNAINEGLNRPQGELNASGIAVEKDQSEELSRSRAKADKQWQELGAFNRELGRGATPEAPVGRVYETNADLSAQVEQKRADAMKAKAAREKAAGAFDELGDKKKAA